MLVECVAAPDGVQRPSRVHIHNSSRSSIGVELRFLDISRTILDIRHYELLAGTDLSFATVVVATGVAKTAIPIALYAMDATLVSGEARSAGAPRTVLCDQRTLPLPSPAP